MTGAIDEREVGATVVHLAARGLVRFEGFDKYYVISQTTASVPCDLPADKLAVYRAMFNLDAGDGKPFAGRLRTDQKVPQNAFLLPPTRRPI